MAFDIQIAHSVEEIGQEAWDCLSGDRPFASYHWYRFGETVLADDVPIYIILSHQGEPAARGTFWLRRREQLPISSRIVRLLMEAILSRWPLLICQSPLVEASGLVLPQDQTLRDGAVGTIARVAQEQAREHRVSFLACDYLEEHEARNTGWPNAFATIEFQNPGTRLIVKWPDFESYLSHLSRSARRDYRRHRKRAAKRNIKVERLSLVQPLDETTLDEAVALIRNVERRHNSAPKPWARAMLRHACMVDAMWLKAEVEGHLVGCDLLLGDGDTWVMTLPGLDYKTEYTYFQLMYTPIHHAIEVGARSLWGGSGAYELKMRLGFQLTSNNHTTFAGAGPLPHALGRLVAGTEKSEIK